MTAFNPTPEDENRPDPRGWAHRPRFSSLDAGLPLLPDQGQILLERLKERFSEDRRVDRDERQEWERQALMCLSRNAWEIFPFLGERNEFRKECVGSFAAVEDRLIMLVSTGSYEADVSLLLPKNQEDRPRGFSGVLVIGYPIPAQEFSESMRFHRTTLILDQTAYDYQLTKALAGEPSALTSWVSLMHSNESQGSVNLRTFIASRVSDPEVPSRFIAIDQHGQAYLVGWEYDLEVGAVHGIHVSPIALPTESFDREENTYRESCYQVPQPPVSGLLCSNAIARMREGAELAVQEDEPSKNPQLSTPMRESLSIQLREILRRKFGETAWDKLMLNLDILEAVIDSSTGDALCVLTVQERMDPDLNNYVALSPNAIVKDSLFCGYQARVPLVLLTTAGEGLLGSSEAMASIEVYPILSHARIVEELNRLIDPGSSQESVFNRLVTAKLLALCSSSDAQVNLIQHDELSAMKLDWKCESDWEGTWQLFNVTCQTSTWLCVFEIIWYAHIGSVGEFDLVGFWKHSDIAGDIAEKGEV